MRKLLLAAVVFVVGCQGIDSSATVDVGAGSDEIATDVQSALRAFPKARVDAVGHQGVPLQVSGELGKAGSGLDLDKVLKPLAPVFRLNADNLKIRSHSVDALSNTHVKLDQTKNGLRVVGGELIVHLNKDNEVYAVSGAARDGVELPATAKVAEADAQMSVREALAKLEAINVTVAAGELVYLLPTEGQMKLAWVMVAEGEVDGAPLKDRFYVDAQSGAVVQRHAMLHSALNRRIYTSKNTTSLPGTQIRVEGGAATGDAVADKNYELLGKTYDCYKNAFGRDSINGNGLMLRSSVHYARNYANAYWDGYQMVYGDGDWQYASFALSYDVTVHELTHGVTEYESNLVYQGEPGALNESISDIFGAYCESVAAGGVTANTWKMAEEIYTPGTAGDAMRYMDNPTRDGWSTDYYPTRYTGTEDYGGVHLNSGISNLAFKLLVTGGTHPRGRTTNNVPAVGMEKAAKIFYRANTNYMTSNSNFQAARAATAQAAADLYDAATVAAVHAAWTAVGVPGAPTAPAPAPAPAPSGSTLSNGVAKSVSGATGSEVRFTFVVPAGATNVKFQLAGGTGDGDLYVKFGSAPTSTSFDYRPYLDGNNETVLPSPATAGTWHVMVRGYSTYSGATLTASYTP